MSIVGLLEEMERLDAAQAEDDGQETASFRRGAVVEELLCVDGVTRFSAPPAFRAFYAFRTPWRLRAIQLVWPGAGEMGRLLREAPIAGLVSGDIDKGMLPVPEAKRHNTVLLAYDYLPAAYQRAYVVFGGADDYMVVDAGSEIVRYPALADYLGFWKNVLQA